MAYGVPPTRVMSDTGDSMMEQLPPYYAGDRIMEAVQDAQGREWERLEYARQKVRDGLAWPQLADDEFRTLGMWEAMLKLPIEPSDATVDQRRATVMATLKARFAKQGQDWEARISEMLGSGTWSYYEGPGDYEITINFPYAAGSYRAYQVRQFARRVTPAHLHITVITGEAFLVGGPSQIGLDRL